MNKLILFFVENLFAKIRHI